MKHTISQTLPRTTAAIAPVATLAVLAVLVATTMAGCVSRHHSAQRAAVERDAVVFEPGTIPPELLEVITEKNVTLIGETHYVQEHQTLLVDLAAATGARDDRPLVMLQEGEHAWSWLVEDYVNGTRHDYPPWITALDGGVIEGLRRVNRRTRDDHRISYRYFDMNHGTDSAQVSLRVMALELGISPLVAELVATDPDGDAYDAVLDSLADRVAENRTELTDRIGEHWYQRLTGVIEIEQRSLPLRRDTRRGTSWNQRREEIMIDLATAEMSRSSDADRRNHARVLINTGMFHAQLERAMGTRHTWLGEFLVQHPEYTGGRHMVYSLAVFGLRGERIFRFYDPNPEPIPSPEERSRYNLVRTLDQVARTRVAESGRPGAVFLDLSDPVFSRPARVAFAHRREYRARPNRQFDGYLVFPEISVSRGLLQRDE